MEKPKFPVNSKTYGNHSCFDLSCVNLPDFSKICQIRTVFTSCHFFVLSVRYQPKILLEKCASLLGNWGLSEQKCWSAIWHVFAFLRSACTDVFSSCGTTYSLPFGCLWLGNEFELTFSFLGAESLDPQVGHHHNQKKKRKSFFLSSNSVV